MRMSGVVPGRAQVRVKNGHKLWTSTSQEHWEVEHHLRQHQGMPRPVHVASVSFDLQSHKRPGLSIPLLSWRDGSVPTTLTWSQPRVLKKQSFWQIIQPGWSWEALSSAMLEIHELLRRLRKRNPTGQHHLGREATFLESGDGGKE